jgi:hypothetical protein
LDSNSGLFEGTLQHSPKGRTEESLTQYSWYSGQDSNRILPEYKSEDVLLSKLAWFAFIYSSFL